GSGSHIVGLEDVSEGGGRFDGRGDRECPDRPCGGDAVAGMNLVVAVDDRLQRRTGPQCAGDAADTGADLRIADRNAYLVGQIPTDLRGQVADRVDLAGRGRIQATLQAAQDAA